MCWHNLTQHSGCGHIGERYIEPWTLCPKALARLNADRGPSTPAFIPPPTQPGPPKRYPTSSKTIKFFRSSADAMRSKPKKEAQSVPKGVPVISSYRDLPPHVLVRVRCTGAELNERTLVDAATGGKKMNVCQNCKKSIDDMCTMINLYNKNGSIKGTNTYRNFLQNPVGGAE